MIRETIYACGCTSIGRSRICRKHLSPIVAVTSAVRQKTSATIGNHQVELCKRSEFKAAYKLIVGGSGVSYEAITAAMLTGKDVSFVSLDSLRILRLALNVCRHAQIHTTHPVILRAARTPDLITVMTRNGAGKFYAKKQAAA